ncbi:ABC transporter permease [candidate division KSB1 bacterium]
MLKNYFLIALRNIKKQKIYSFINITGLIVGMVCCILILLYVQYELSYDSFHQKANRIYRVSPTYHRPEGTVRYTRISPLAVPTLKQELPEIEDGVRFLRWPEQTFKYKNIMYNEESFAYVDEEVFNIFTIPLLKGDPGSALKNIYSIVLSETAAEKYFGKEEPVGKILNFNSSLDFKVTGVMKNMPKNSHFHFDLLASMKTYASIYGKYMNTWGGNVYYSYILLKEGISVDDLSPKIIDFTERHMGQNWEEGQRTDYELTALCDIHLHSHRRQEFRENGNILYVYGFSVIAGFILLLACVNFMNLSTARASTRIKEISLRKTVGGTRKQLIVQFMSESVVLCLGSLIAAICIVRLLIPYFNVFFNADINLDIYDNFFNIIYFSGFALFTGLFAGSYPALYLSSFQPASSLKGELKSGYKAVFIRKALVVFQFVISITLIIGTILSVKQIDYMKSRDLGFDQNNILTMKYPGNERFKTLKSELNTIPEVKHVTASGDIIGRMFTSLGVKTEAMDRSSSTIALIVDPDFLNVYDMKVLAGRNFRDSDIGNWSDADWKKGMIINEKAVKEFGFNSPEEAVGRRIQMNSKAVIAGVVKDFNYFSLHRNSGTLVMAVWPDWFTNVSIKVTGSDIQNTIGKIRETWIRLVPDKPFEFSFFDDSFNNLYKTDEKFSSLFYSFSILGIFIACLGLFGVASFTIEQKTKEIGIRKILGASVTGLVKLLSKDFFLLIVFSNLIAWPAGYLIMKKWIQENFAYSTSIGLQTFLIAGIFSVIVAVAAISYHIIKAAVINPVDTLRN